MSLTDKHKATVRQLLGSPIIYQGMQCVVMELLEEDASLVLERMGSRNTLQADQYGDPGRHVAETITLPLLADDDSGGFHPEFCKLGLASCD